MTDPSKTKKKLEDTRAVGNEQKYWDYGTVASDFEDKLDLSYALSEHWYGYVLECLGKECYRLTGTLKGKLTASNANCAEWHERSLQPHWGSSFVHQIRKTSSARSLKKIARWVLKQDLTGPRDCVTNGLKLVRSGTQQYDAVLGYSLIGLALNELPTVTPCQFSFCFRNVPVPHDGKRRKFCDVHTPGSARYVQARFYERRLNGGNGLNPKQSSWAAEEIEKENAIAGYELSPEAKQDVLEMIEEMAQMERDKGVADIDPLPYKLNVAKLRVVREMERTQYENLGLIEPLTQTNWRVVTQEWYRMYPWLPQTILTARSWPSAIDILRLVLNDNHCSSHSIRLWDAKLQNRRWEQELIYSYDCRRRPPLSDQIALLDKGGLNQNEIASRLRVSKARVSQCVRNDPRLQHLRRKTVRKFGVNMESNRVISSTPKSA